MNLRMSGMNKYKKHLLCNEMERNVKNIDTVFDSRQFFDPCKNFMNPRHPSHPHQNLDPRHPLNPCHLSYLADSIICMTLPWKGLIRKRAENGRLLFSTTFTAKYELVSDLTQENAWLKRFHFMAIRKIKICYFTR